MKQVRACHCRHLLWNLRVFPASSQRLSDSLGSRQVWGVILPCSYNARNGRMQRTYEVCSPKWMMYGRSFSGTSGKIKKWQYPFALPQSSLSISIRVWSCPIESTMISVCSTLVVLGRVMIQLIRSVHDPRRSCFHPNLQSSLMRHAAFPSSDILGYWAKSSSEIPPLLP